MWPQPSTRRVLHADTRRGSRIDAIVLAVALSIGITFAAAAGDIVIRGADLRYENDILMLDANAELLFSEDAIDALMSGIALTMELELRIDRPRRFVWDKEIFATTRRYSIQRHALSDQFVLTSLVTGERRVHRSLENAIADLGRVQGLPLAERDDVTLPEETLNALRWRLAIDALPAPMIPLAYVSPSWRMSSGWYRWQTTR